MDSNDLMTLKALERDNTLTPYEQFKIGHMQSKKASGVAIAGLAVGIGASVAALGAGLYATSKAKAAQDIATAQNNGTAALLAQTASLLATERAERVNGDLNITNTISDTQSGSQQGTIANQIENSAMAQAQATLMTQALLGNLSENAQKVQIYSAPQPCGCPGCGCNV